MAKLLVVLILSIMKCSGVITCQGCCANAIIAPELQMEAITVEVWNWAATNKPAASMLGQTQRQEPIQRETTESEQANTPLLLYKCDQWDYG